MKVIIKKYLKFGEYNLVIVIYMIFFFIFNIFKNPFYLNDTTVKLII